jgi:hypothetical protein
MVLFLNHSRTIAVTGSPLISSSICITMLLYYIYVGVMRWWGGEGKVGSWDKGQYIKLHNSLSAASSRPRRDCEAPGQRSAAQRRSPTQACGGGVLRCMLIRLSGHALDEWFFFTPRDTLLPCTTFFPGGGLLFLIKNSDVSRKKPCLQRSFN